jgi:hypothetical protein
MPISMASMAAANIHSRTFRLHGPRKDDDSESSSEDEYRWAQALTEIQLQCIYHSNEICVVKCMHALKLDGCRDDTLDENRMIRSRKLQALKKEELSTATLRSLFRLLDEDGSLEVSAQEIRHGLILLGFDEAADPIALSRILSDIDEDNTGTITESEFLTFFSKQNRTSISRLLKSYVLEHTFIIATTYGA